jgi:hypothetical protein
MEPHSRTLTFTVLSGDVIDGDAVVVDMVWNWIGLVSLDENVKI